MCAPVSLWFAGGGVSQTILQALQASLRNLLLDVTPADQLGVG